MKEFFIKRKIQKYRRQLVKYADDPELLKTLADLYWQIEENHEAQMLYEQAIEAYYQPDTRIGNDNEFILEVCQVLLELDPLNSLAHKTLGQEYCGLGEFREAAALYQAFAERLINAGQFEDAISEYQNVLVLTPDAVPVREKLFSLLCKFRRKKEAVQELRKLAELAEHSGNLVRALQCYKKALKILPDDPDLRAEAVRLARQARSQEVPLRLVVNK